MKRILLVGLLLPISMTMAAGEKTRVTVLDASSANYLEVKDNKGVKSWIRVNGVLCDEPDTYYGKAALLTPKMSTSLPRWIYNRFFMSVEA